MAARKQHRNGYQAWTYALAGLLALTNSAWFLSSRIKANDHAAALAAAQRPAEVKERVVYEYRDQPSSQREAAPQPGTQRILEPHEQCRGGLVFSKRGNEWSSAGEICDPTLV